jgi:hypothetical protein
MNNNGRGRPEAKVEELAAKKVEATARARGTDSPKPGVPLDFSVEVDELLTRAESDPASAMDLLKMLARDLRARKLPNRMLADYIAGAIEEASAAGPKADHQGTRP